ncbi:MAG: Lrp/AsnC ligand binding domain-containing protein [Candidatus Scalinduaceae bacterium]
MDQCSFISGRKKIIPISAYVLVRIAPANLDIYTLNKNLSNIEGVHSVVSVLGQYDFVVQVKAGNLKVVDSVSKKIKEVSGVRDKITLPTISV